jgi:hypothetical protein
MRARNVKQDWLFTEAEEHLTFHLFDTVILHRNISVITGARTGDEASVLVRGYMGKHWMVMNLLLRSDRKRSGGCWEAFGGPGAPFFVGPVEFFYRA